MRLRSILLAAVILAAGSVRAYAGTVTATFSSLTDSQNLTFHWTDAGGGHTDTNQPSGRFLWNVNSTSSPIGTYGTSFFSFCVDLSQNVSPGSQYTFTETLNLTSVPIGGSGQAMTSQAANDLALLYGAFYNDLIGSPNVVGKSYNSIAYTGAQMAAAFQLAVWEIVEDDGINGLSLSNTSSRFYDTTDTTVVTLANWYLTHLGSKADQLVALYSTGAQDQVVFVPVNITGVPLPGAVAAGLPILMLGGATLKSKRRRQRDEILANA